ncbi:MAG: cobalamin-dependent protein [Phycisphaerae bacterium]|nr:cobalamin-dependent protein [Phycisphaerae bacterium]
MKPLANSAANFEATLEQFFGTLVSGDRPAARALVNDLYDSGMSAETVSRELFWPALEMVHTLYRGDQISPLAHGYATRLLRMLVDQAQARYTMKARRNRKICLFCGPNEPEELAGQLVADLCEADGYDVWFGGGGIPNDEILAEVGQQEPDFLVMFASCNRDAPNIRLMIDRIRAISACPRMQVVVGGGIFNRAPGLAEEIGADVSATSPGDLLTKLLTGADGARTREQPVRIAKQTTVKTRAAA